MTHQELVDFFKFAGLEYKEDQESIQLLKKQLLLELKATSDDSLVISGKRYGKNDLVTLFDANSSKTATWDPQTIKNEYRSLNDFMNSKAFVSPTAFPKSIVDHPDFYTYSAAEIQPRFADFLRMVQLNLKEHELRTVASAVQFLIFFTPEQQFRITTDLKLIVRNAMTKVKAGLLKGGRVVKAMPEADYFVNHNFYEILLKIGHDDLDFLMEQLGIGEDVMKIKRNAFDSLRFFRFQLLLPFPEEVIVVLKKNERITNKANASEASSDSPGVGRIIWISFVVILFVFRFATRCNRSEPKVDDSLLRMLQERQQQRQLQQDQYYESLDPEDSLLEQAPATTTSPPLNVPQTGPPPPADPVQEVISVHDSL
jgi:hypothetical protein